jgi:uncharacterized membrane protein/uncharacterized membrane protein YidH (DUF202 family)
MDLAHVHLLLNHWPILGSLIALALYALALAANSDDLKQVSLAFYALLALLAVPTYISGNAADEVLKKTAGWPTDLVHAHQGAAMLGLIFIEITGLAALIGLWQYSRMSRPFPQSVARWNAPVVMILSVATCLVMTVAGNTGGAIRHQEAAGGTSAVAAFGAKVVPATQYFVTEYSRWIWPGLETLHFFGLILIVAAFGVLNVRLLGFLKGFPVAPMHRLLPWGIAGLVINVTTGMLFFVGMPFFYVWNPVMYMKIAAIVIAGTALLFFYCTSAFLKWGKLGPNDDPPPLAKFVAGLSLFLWAAIIVLGRYIPVTQESLK